MALRSGSDRALEMLRTLPRVSLGNLYTQFVKRNRRHRGQHGGGTHGCSRTGPKHHQRYLRLGYTEMTASRNRFYLSVPMEHYYQGHQLRRQYPPLTLLQLQLLIDTNRLDASQPIDITSICNTGLIDFNPLKRHYGFQLTDHGIDNFNAKINIEVQWTTEAVIAAIEKNGGTITTSYYDIDSLFALRDPMKFFSHGVPIPKRMMPPEDAVEYYTDPKFRGYLADPDAIAQERFVLAQKYGYILPDLNSDPQKDLLLMRKDPLQIFYGLSPGWVVNLRDKCILKPKDKNLNEYYSS